ncbi:DNA-methyltransferase [Lactobacillus hominis]|uniref:Methyltransferase n=1 Tax=Lactobacillus hominis DSM 23910 = CRBIP 24.179 TaxID=1423758 RepID=I7L9Q1_9LACO|nr:site-specific DNA-methyltransferase [Lactobacillus hominis]KRM85865.1 modification methylase DpnIIB-like protein [Lactobacillus hominis DSM 23910 = CRBIP 24.179]MCT3348898.1 site-specific DNA-methyltransferase [Lactobacillus hominis]CCI81584.1 ORF13 [Lactobacillus hominis DSM 23910 = CRBIP 24.179]
MLSKDQIEYKKIENLKCELYCDNFENFKRYGIPKAQLIIADIPYNIGNNAYASNPQWYKDGEIENGESKLANSNFFNRDEGFNVVNFMKFARKLLIKEPKETGKAPAMIVFCSWQQMPMLIDQAKEEGFKHAYPLFFTKKTSSQVLKANMRIVGATEFALVLYRDKLPKFNNHGHMVLDHMKWKVDDGYPKIHPTQKPIPVLKRLISLFTDPGDVVIDPTAGSGSTLRAASELGRNAYGFEVERDIYNKAQSQMLNHVELNLIL